MNKHTLCPIAAFFLALPIANAVHAAYNGLSVTSLHTTVTLDPFDPELVDVPVTIHRVWADFTNPDDALFVWGGGGGLGTCTINNTNSMGTGPGSGFLNNAFGTLLPPNTSTFISNSDSYFTIGVTLQNQIPSGQGISLLGIPGNPIDVTGTSVSLSPQGGGVSTTPTTSSGAPNPIALAGFIGDGDTALRVLLMQLTVAQGELVNGTLGITINLGPLAGATTTIPNQTFVVFPTPPSTCCQPTTCSFVTPGECETLGGVIVSVGVGTCLVCQGGCCASDGTCSITTFANCAAAGGTFRGYNTPCPAVCTPGDITGDGEVGTEDLLVVIKDWGGCPVPCPPCVGDTNSSCTVDMNDLLYVILHWLP